MTKITVLPHPELAPTGLVFNAVRGISLCKNLLNNGVNIEHACDMVCACTTCHIIIRQGFNTLPPITEAEEDKLDRAWGLQSTSRLSCQTIVGEDELTIEIPRYSINHAKEGIK